MAAIAAVGDDAGQRRADLGFDFGQDGRQWVAIVGIARQRLHMCDELPAFRAMERRGERDLDAELTWALLRQACFNVA